MTPRRSQSLFGDVEIDAPKKRTRATATNGDVARVIDGFHDRFVVKFGFKPKISGGKDGVLAKQLLAWAQDDGGFATVCELLDEFFASVDPRVVRSDYTFGAFASLAQYLRVKRANPVASMDRRTLENIEAGARAARPTKGR